MRFDLIMGDCASVMATSAHVTTRAMSTNAPMSLRMRMVMIRQVRLRQPVGITIWSARHQQANEVMTRTLPPPAIRHHAIGLWLWTVAALMVVTLIVGGATRLTESGLSIVEWKPVTGVVPPVSDTAWQAEFDKYKTIPQFRERNAAMTLSEFKLIYWWEWSHRMLARLIGAVFLLPFLWFFWRGWIEPDLRRAALGHLRIGRRTWRGRLVDGLVGPDRAGERLAIPAGVSSDAGLRHLCRHRLDGRAARAARAHVCAWQGSGGVRPGWSF